MAAAATVGVTTVLMAVALTMTSVTTAALVAAMVVAEVTATTTVMTAAATAGGEKQQSTSIGRAVDTSTMAGDGEQQKRVADDEGSQKEDGKKLMIHPMYLSL